jgi:hypothetical protein
MPFLQDHSINFLIPLDVSSLYLTYEISRFLIRHSEIPSSHQKKMGKCSWSFVTLKNGDLKIAVPFETSNS